jgi:hypothetical protein
MGAHTSSTFSELFLQYIEQTALYNILIHYNILGYFRYVDDILIVYDTSLTDIDSVLNSFNTAASPLQFTIEKERHQHINFLDIVIHHDTHHFTFSIFRKPTTTDSIIPSSSCHPQEHKYSAIQYLHNRLSTYPISNQHRIQEEHTIAHILHQNNYPPITPPPREHKSQHRSTSNTQPTQLK